jgi:tripartite-type tricarboxylate transporter receptor subunit TctC
MHVRSIVRIAAGRCAWLSMAVAVIAVAVGFHPAAMAQQFPVKPIRIVVPFAPGGTVDVSTRVVSQRLAEVLGQSVLIDNKPGANGIIGGDFVAKSAPDGHTLFAVSSTHVINPSTTASMPFDPVKDFSHVTILGTLPLVIVGGVEQPFRSLPEMISHAKSRSGQVFFGYTDNSTLLFGEMFKGAAGIDLRMVPYKGGAPMLVDLLGGHIQIGGTGAGSAHANYKAGKIRVLAVSESRRTPSMPEVPTIAESGVPGFNVQVWIAVMGPAGMPPAIVNRLNAEIVKVLAEPAVAGRLTEIGTVIRGSSPAEAAQTLRADAEMWSAAAKKAGLKPE